MTITTTTTDIELSATERDELERCEQRIDHLRQAFTEAGAALQAIREQRLYRALHRTFEEYCQQRWGFSRVQAHRLIQAADVSHNLLPIGNIVMPENEAQARPLTKLDTPEAQQEAWKEAVERSGGKPTARVVGEVVEERTRQRIDSMPADERKKLFDKLARRRLRHTGGSYNDGKRTYHMVRDVHAYGDMHERHTITYIDEAEALLKMVVPPAPPSRWSQPAQPAEPPPEQDAFENTMSEALDEPEFVDIGITPGTQVFYKGHVGILEVVTREPLGVTAWIRWPTKVLEPVNPSDIIVKESVPQEILDLLHRINPTGTVEQRVHGGQNQFRTTVPTGRGGFVLLGWSSADGLRQCLEEGTERLNAETKQVTDQIKTLPGMRVDEVFWGDTDGRVIPFFVIRYIGHGYTAQTWSYDQVMVLLKIADRFKERVEAEQQEVDKARKVAAQADLRRYEAEQQVKLSMEEEV